MAHTQKRARISSPSTYSCKCGKSFEKYREFQSHLRTHKTKQSPPTEDSLMQDISSIEDSSEDASTEIEESVDEDSINDTGKIKSYYLSRLFSV